jgi:hypothetical protein
MGISPIGHSNVGGTSSSQPSSASHSHSCGGSGGGCGFNSQDDFSSSELEQLLTQLENSSQSGSSNSSSLDQQLLAALQSLAGSSSP